MWLQSYRLRCCIELYLNKLNFFQGDGGRLYSRAGRNIKVSQAILDRFKANGELASSDEGLALCILFNNKDCLEYDREGQPGVNQNMSDFLKGKINLLCAK